MTTPTQAVSEHPLAFDLEAALARLEPWLGDLRGARLFITGGTGFYGSWLLETLLWAEDRLRLGTHAVVLTRHPDVFCRRAPHLARHPVVRLHAGEICEFPFPDGSFTHVIHAASEMVVMEPAGAVGLLETTLRGLRRVAELAQERGARRFLYASSGAVYGPAVPGRGPVSEDDPPGALAFDAGSAYAEAKRLGELSSVLLGRQHGFDVILARGFAFLGPYLPLDSHRAAAQFMADVLRGRPPVVRGTGTAVRSYLYGADLAVWLWTLLLRGVSGRPYNVGSDQPITILALAEAVAAAADPSWQVVSPRSSGVREEIDYYVPDIARAREELGLDVFTPLPDSIRRTLAWHRQSASVRS